jgi:hypothetical protein
VEAWRRRSRALPPPPAEYPVEKRGYRRPEEEAEAALKAISGQEPFVDFPVPMRDGRCAESIRRRGKARSPAEEPHSCTTVRIEPPRPKKIRSPRETESEGSVPEPLRPVDCARSRLRGPFHLEVRRKVGTKSAPPGTSMRRRHRALQISSLEVHHRRRRKPRRRGGREPRCRPNARTPGSAKAHLQHLSETSRPGSSRKAEVRGVVPPPLPSSRSPRSVRLDISIATPRAA